MASKGARAPRKKRAGQPVGPLADWPAVEFDWSSIEPDWSQVDFDWPLLDEWTTQEPTKNKPKPTKKPRNNLEKPK